MNDINYQLFKLRIERMLLAVYAGPDKAIIKGIINSDINTLKSRKA